MFKHISLEFHAGEHSINHINWKTNPDLVEIVFKLSDKEKFEFEAEIKNRIDIIEGYKKQITTETFEYIQKIQDLCFRALKKLNDAVCNYKELLKNDYFDIDSKTNIQKLIKNCIDPNIIEKSLKIHEDAIKYYNTDFLKEINFLQSNTAEKLYADYNLYVQAHTLFVYCVAISHDDKYVASGSHDKTIRV